MEILTDVCAPLHIHIFANSFPWDSDTLETMNPLSSQILVCKYSYIKKEQKLCGMIQGWDTGSPSPEHLIVPQSNEMLKKWWRPKSTWTSSRWPKLGQSRVKINNENIRLLSSE